MKLFSLLIFVVLFISQVMPGYRHGEVYHFCDSQTSVCLRRKKNCMTRMPGMCPGRSFCCVRMK
uniref:Beta-defensin 139 n=3 Tax=Canis lupus TaxID=9612 RepID=Q30KR7_CANLF|nr:beta-defensin 139 [Canis lupus familiaris]